MADVEDGCGKLIVCDVLCKVGYRVVLSYLVMCYGDRVTGHSGCVCGHSWTFSGTPSEGHTGRNAQYN